MKFVLILYLVLNVFKIILKIKKVNAVVNNIALSVMTAKFVKNANLHIFYKKVLNNVLIIVKLELKAFIQMICLIISKTWEIFAIIKNVQLAKILI